jgi:DNA-binding transcriptional ArsR family regulator
LVVKLFSTFFNACLFSSISYYLSIDLIKCPLYHEGMDVFSALAEPHRRSILEMLASEGQLSASAIAHKFRLSAPAISQHLKILREAGLLRMEKHAQQRLYQVNPQAMHELEHWARRMAEQYERRYGALERIAQREQEKDDSARSDTIRKGRRTSTTNKHR